ncbi:hypothetical protein [Paraclostridium sordellii]|uniref:Transposase n=1 Tax=Paraclostridium sordellii TaxID=1505 RepID=A0A0C7R310_PARSO|nr:hypothetical protein [Paeniclostridium sordellii]QYE99745.1 hypothetical protein KZ987_07365 [Paeniclostridium sordellii]CEN78119.1 transposase [[Clostridium] sordellii] [Paeniclostridium sordellii]CEO07541.1 transposase [[Clostridium] sordellii] [Paeniclostridium sordellii]CEP86923.1 transposase [[Clostridium] sordellii] [Paeniclostridium sordellii]CEP99363.1 transposase [[Clostridium] sordellii] [Paeniclostridium sordellii]
MLSEKSIWHKFKPAKVSDNVLNREFSANKPLEKICMYINIPISNVSQRFIYMNVAKDLFNGEIIAYDISSRNDTILVKNTIDKLTKMNLSDNCKLHADQWFQYTIKQYSTQLK